VGNQLWVVNHENEFKAMRVRLREKMKGFIGVEWIGLNELKPTDPK
jgi:hypothetical protein